MMDQRLIVIPLLILALAFVMCALFTSHNISYIHGPQLKQVIYCFWTGTNPLTENRTRSLSQLKKVTGFEIVLVTPNNLHNYILSDHPLHSSYVYLSETHKSDYLRTYFMHFHGGGYTDIKQTKGSWKDAFADLEQSDKWINGYQEFGAGHVAYVPLQNQYKSLIGNASYICKPQTPFTSEWYDEMITLLESKLAKLKQHPATNPRDRAENSEYPIEWNEMLGRIFHKVCFKYRDKVLQTVPECIIVNYR